MIVERLTIEVASPRFDFAVCIRICGCNQIEIAAQRIADTEMHEGKRKPKPECRPMTAWELD